MSKTPLVDSLGVFVEHAGMPGAYVSATDLEAALEKLPKVIRCAHWSEEQWSTQEHIIGGKTGQEFIETHTARLLGIQEITKEPMKVEHIVSFPEGHRCYAINGEEFGSKLAGKKFKVTYEEIEG